MLPSDINGAGCVDETDKMGMLLVHSVRIGDESDRIEDVRVVLEVKQSFRERLHKTGEKNSAAHFSCRQQRTIIGSRLFVLLDVIEGSLNNA